MAAERGAKAGGLPRQVWVLLAVAVCLRVAALGVLDGPDLVSASESGLTAAWWGAVPAVVVGGCATLVVAGLWTRLFPELASMDRFPDPDPGAGAVAVPGPGRAPGEGAGP